MRIAAAALMALHLCSCYEVDAPPAKARIACSESDTWCPDGFYCNVDRWECRRFQCAEECGADERCVDGLCVEWLGCELSLGSGCSGCGCEACVCESLPECCSNRWGPECIHRCRLCGGCGVVAPSPCDDDCPSIEWVEFEGGSFTMGQDGVKDNELPAHPVTLAPFMLARTELRVGQYRGCVESGYCPEPQTALNIPECHWGMNGYDDHPMNCISWYEARTFCEWIGARLPSEAEWEYAARSGGKDKTYPWGEDRPNCSFAVIWDWEVSGCAPRETWPVCSVPAGNTEDGLCDMAGNVAEWVEDDYHGSYDCESLPDDYHCDGGGVAPTDGSAWVDSPRRDYRGHRGDGYRLCSDSCYRTVSRDGTYPTTDASDDIGFRPARSLK